jgi:chromosome segregation ATPase
MTRDVKRVNAIIDMTLYDNVMKLGYATITEAITKGLELLLDKTEPNTKESSNSSNPELLTSLKDRIESLEDQLKTKDKQLENKDIQIEKLNSNTQQLNENIKLQALNIQNLLTQKQISETTEKKKPFWKFW